MIKRYCDCCGKEIEKTVTTERITGAPIVNDVTIHFEVMSGVNQAINAGDLCVDCLLKAINICYGPDAKF